MAVLDIYVLLYIYSGMRNRPSPRPAIGPAGARKTRITIYLDSDVIAWFRKSVSSTNGSYQKAINHALRDHIAREPLEATLRRLLREELARALGRPTASAYSYEPAALVADARSEYGVSTERRRADRASKKRR